MKKRPEIMQALYAQFYDYKPRKGDLRKIAIIETAIDCLATVGVEATSFETIGKKLGIGRAHVAYYFPDRQDLVEAAFKFVIATGQTFSIESLKAANGKMELEAFVNGTFEWFHAYPRHASVYLFLFYQASFERRFRKLHDEIRATGRARIQAVLENSMPARQRKEAPHAARLVQALLTGHLVEFYSTQPVGDLEAQRLRTQKDIARLMQTYR